MSDQRNDVPPGENTTPAGQDQDARDSDGRWRPGVSGNPAKRWQKGQPSPNAGGRPKIAEQVKTRSQALAQTALEQIAAELGGNAEASNIAMELLTERLRQAKDHPTKVVSGPDGREWLEPTMADKDVIAALATLAKHGGAFKGASLVRLFEVLAGFGHLLTGADIARSYATVARAAEGLGPDGFAKLAEAIRDSSLAAAIVEADEQDDDDDEAAAAGGEPDCEGKGKSDE